jgi:23S rRNA (uracil1939-C5)-methyltransferase
MARGERQTEPKIYENIEIIDAGSEGKAVARIGNLVVFIPFAVPGDVADIQIVKKKRSYREGKILKLLKNSDKRAEPFCSHFGTCGGCRWQNMRYEDQLFYKQKQVTDSFERIGGTGCGELIPILPSENTTYYRNKLEFTFSSRKWMTGGVQADHDSIRDRNALGFHIPRLFDKVLDIDHCYLQQDPSNAIRLEAKRYSLDHGLTFYDARTWEGFMRNLLIRTSGTHGLMVIFVFRVDLPEVIHPMLDHIASKFPEITSLYYVINSKKNDVISDLKPVLYKGKAFIHEALKSFNAARELTFRLGPLSFFQTNSAQARHLYEIAAGFAGFTGGENVYDLYCGTGTISCYVADSAGKVTGIESVADAVRDAKENAAINGITNAEFVAGEAEKILTDDFISIHGRPDVIITDPPRSGMHPKVVQAILSILPGKIVYVSCNPATQARDVAMLKEKYLVVKCRPVDMFPHTQHVENVALLECLG